MGLIADLIPVYYTLIRVGIQRANGNVVAIADLRILNADSRILCHHNPSTALTPQEKQVIGNFVNREMAAFEAATGLTEWEEPE